MSGIIQVAIVDDDAMFRYNVAQLLAQPGSCLKLVGSLSSAQSALQELPLLRPHVLLMDINLPRISGVECVRTLAPQLPKTQIMMLTVSEDSERIFESLRAGATGYLVKRDVVDKLYSSIIALHEGGSPMTNSVARKVALAFRQLPPLAAGESYLTEREEEILAALTRGSFYKEIATEFGISYNTVRAHVQHIYRKLQVRYRAEAIKKFKSLHS